MANPSQNPSSQRDLAPEAAFLKGEIERLSSERDAAWDFARSLTKKTKPTDISRSMREAQKALERINARIAHREELEGELVGLKLENESLRSAITAQTSAFEILLKAKNEITAQYEENLALYRELRDFYENLSVAYQQLLERLMLANARLWSPKSERTPEGQLSYLSLFNDVEDVADKEEAEAAESDADAPEVDEDKSADAKTSSSKPRKRGGKRRLDAGDLKVVVVEDTLEDQSCPECGAPLDSMKVEVTRRLHYRPAELWIEEHRRHLYVCPACSKKNAEGSEKPAVLLRAPLPAAPLGKSPASADLLANIIHRRYELAMPLRRIELDYASLGADISRANLAQWVLGISKRYLEPLSDRMLYHLRSLEVLHADETTVKVLREPGRKATSTSYMWVVTSSPPDPQIQIFHYAPTRSGSVIRELLSGWSGYLMTDGYQAYYSLGSGVTNVACLAHVRRKFKEIENALGSGQETRVASEAVKRLDAMFAVDRGFSALEPEERRLKRLESLEPLMTSFEKWAKKERAKTPEGFALTHALDYALNHWIFAKNVLLDGRLELSNNRCERVIKPFTLGRRSSLFSDSQRGAKASGACYSIVTTARANGLDATRYIEWLLTELPAKGGPKEEALDAYLPWADTIPESLRMTEVERRAAARNGRKLTDPLISQREIDRITAEVDKEVDELIG